MAKRPLVQLSAGGLGELPLAEILKTGAVVEMLTTSAPAAPPAGSIYVYALSDGHIYTINSSGVLRQLTIPVGTTAPTSPEVGYLWVDTN